MNSTRILIFAKAPVPGRVKTRLIPALGAAGAVQLARHMLDHTLGQALEAGIGPVELCASPAVPDPAWADYPLPHGVETSDQGEGDLGERMARASQRALAQGACRALESSAANRPQRPIFHPLLAPWNNHAAANPAKNGLTGADFRYRRPKPDRLLETRVLLIGTDCPGLSARHLRAAAAALQTHDAALYRALDGGYPLLGLRAFHPSLFAAIPWSTSSVAELTLARMQDLAWRVWLGDTLAGIDEPADLIHLPAHLHPDASPPFKGVQSC